VLLYHLYFYYYDYCSFLFFLSEFLYEKMTSHLSLYLPEEEGFHFELCVHLLQAEVFLDVVVIVVVVVVVVATVYYVEREFLGFETKSDRARYRRKKI